MPDNKKYNEIVLLVHPLFSVIYGPVINSVLNTKHNDLSEYIIDKSIYNQKPRTEEEILAFIQNSKALQVRLKKALAEYGKRLLEYKKRPNTLVIIFKSYNPITVDKINDLELSRLGNDEKRKRYEAAETIFQNIYDRLTNRLINFAKRELGEERVIVSDYFFERSKSPITPRLVSKLEPKIKLRSFGEYSNRCVEEWGESVYLELFKRGIRSDFKVIRSSSIVSETEKPHKEINDRFLFGHDRRVQREREKKQKLRQRKHFVK